MTPVTRSRLIVLIVLALAAGTLLYVVATREDPRATTPVVREDGSYRPGSLGDVDDEAAVRAAVSTLPDALSYDYRSLDASLTTATEQMTARFAATFSETFDATTRTMATEKQAVTSALVRGAGLVSRSGSKAEVLVYLDQVLLASKARKVADPLKVSQNRVHVALRKVDGEWLVDGIAPF